MTVRTIEVLAAQASSFSKPNLGLASYLSALLGSFWFLSGSQQTTNAGT
jgi:hypothetical protein